MESSGGKLKRQVGIVETIKTRDELQEVVDFLAAHDTHGSRIAWNIKVYDQDITADVRKKFSLDKRWDDRWDKVMETDFHILDWASRDGLGWAGDEKSQDYSYIEGHADKDLSNSNYVIWQAGRSGGWLELHKFNCSEPDFSEIKDLSENGVKTFEEYCDWVIPNVSFEELTEGDLDDALTGYVDEYLAEVESHKLLKLFVEEVDKFDAGNELRYQLGFQRQQLEEEWDEELNKEIMQESFAMMDTAA